jgi:Glycosyltransferase family 87
MADLRIGRERIRLYGVGLALIGLTQLRFVSSVGHYWDWVDFYAAGATAGTRALLDSGARAAWGVAHALPVTAFAYTPGFAWFLAPAARVPIPWGFALNAVSMSLIATYAARRAARLYALDPAVSFYTTIGWAPVTAAIVTGQNSPLGLLLSLFAIEGLARDDALRTAVAIGALCYKPTYALPFVLLLLIYGKWKPLAGVVACGAVWYVLSATAAGGDWLWPGAYLRAVSNYVGPDFAYNRFKSVSLPGLLMLGGVSPGAALAVGMVALVGALAWLKVKGADAFHAASLAGVIGVATSAHAWAYDAAMILPAIWWIMVNVKEPGRTRFVVIAFVIAPLWMASHALRFDALALVVLAGMWIALAGKRHHAFIFPRPRFPF